MSGCEELEMGYFSDRDRAIVEALTYDPTCKPGFEILKACLIWPDECPYNLTPEGYEKLCDLWIARSFIHRGLPFSSWPLAPEYFERAWDEALRDNVRWPGFRRLTLSAKDRAYYEEQLRKMAEADEI